MILALTAVVLLATVLVCLALAIEVEDTASPATFVARHRAVEPVLIGRPPETVRALMARAA